MKEASHHVARRRFASAMARWISKVVEMWLLRERAHAATVRQLARGHHVGSARGVQEALKRWRHTTNRRFVREIVARVRQRAVRGGWLVWARRSKIRKATLAGRRSARARCLNQGLKAWVRHATGLLEIRDMAARSLSLLLHERRAAAWASWTGGAAELRDTRAALRSGLGHLLHRE
eukprot:6142708-Prymnesium_polylepis.2